MTVRTLELDALVRSLQIGKGSPHALFLGAGASMSSGVPSAGSCVQRWKRSIFETKNPDLKDAVGEISLPSVQERIDRWLLANALWPAEDEDDYGFFIKECYPIEESRRRFFMDLIKAAKAHTGYRLLGLLAEIGLIRTVWTTNFDGLAAKGVSSNSQIVPIEIGIDCQDRGDREENNEELLCFSLHGDYRYDELKNTPAQLQNQEASLRERLVGTLQRQSLIVCGYSGRDQSIMEALSDAFVQTDAKTRLYWCGFSDEPNEEVAKLLSHAHQAGRDAFYVPEVSFDELNIRLARQCLDGPRAKQAERIIGSEKVTDRPAKSPFKLKADKPSALVKSNSLRLTAPLEAFSFKLKSRPQEGVWRYLREIGDEHGFTAVPLAGNVLALATLDQIRAAFGDDLDGAVQRSPVSGGDFAIVDGSIHSLMKQSLTKAIAAHRDLETNGRDKVWQRVHSETAKIDGHLLPLHRCIRIQLRIVDSTLFLCLDPTYFVPEQEGDSGRAVEAKKSKLGYQHNNDFSDDLDHWRKVLVGDSADKRSIELDYPPGSSAFVFKLDSWPCFAELEEPSKPAVQFDAKTIAVIKHSGRIYSEPKLKFAKKAGWEPTTDTFPLRGLSNNGPFDAEAVNSMAEKDIELAVICPKSESRRLHTFLSGHERALDVKKEGEYLQKYKGFSEIYGCRLIVPNEGDDRWITLQELPTDISDVDGCRMITRSICESLMAISAGGRPVTFILTPDRWARHRLVETDDHVYNIHDDVKAFAVRRGMATQFLDQQKLHPNDPARMWWWLSLAIYTKALRTPWVLNSLDNDTAFVGLGYSVDRKGADDKKVVLGCSHIYNAEGQGLQFRLRNIEDATVRRDKNPYLGFNDSRQMGTMIRDLFYETHYQLPRRVVIHKQFQYTNDEIKGLRAGLEGVKQLELLEINREPALRYLKSKHVGNGKFEIDGFPVSRGTTLKLSNDELLLWVHGATTAVNGRFTYFQGKRRIPSPIVVRRYAGTSDVATIVAEILGLSKMDWNSGDLYSQLPATIQSSKTIASIGRRLAAVGHRAFDYRLFM